MCLWGIFTHSFCSKGFYKQLSTLYFHCERHRWFKDARKNICTWYANTAPMYIRDTSIHRFWYPRRIREPIPCMRDNCELHPLILISEELLHILIWLSMIFCSDLKLQGWELAHFRSVPWMSFLYLKQLEVFEQPWQLVHHKNNSQKCHQAWKCVYTLNQRQGTTYIINPVHHMCPHEILAHCVMFMKQVSRAFSKSLEYSFLFINSTITGDMIQKPPTSSFLHP